MYHIGSVTTTINEQLQQVSPSTPFQYVTTNSKIDDNPSSSNGMAVNGFHPQLNAQANPSI